MPSTSDPCLAGHHGRCYEVDCACTVCRHGTERPRPAPARAALPPSAPRGDRAGRAAYTRQYRRDHPEALQDSKAGMRARARALRRIADLHPTEFQAIYDEERATEGLPPLGTRRPGRRPS